MIWRKKMTRCKVAKKGRLIENTSVFVVFLNDTQRRTVSTGRQYKRMVKICLHWHSPMWFPCQRRDQPDCCDFSGRDCTITPFLFDGHRKSQHLFISDSSLLITTINVRIRHSSSAFYMTMWVATSSCQCVCVCSPVCVSPFQSSQSVPHTRINWQFLLVLFSRLSKACGSLNQTRQNKRSDEKQEK